MGVEEEAHRRLLGDLEEGVKGAKLLEWAPVCLEELLDLLREALGVGSGKPDMAVTHEGMALTELLVVAVGAKEVDDLPHVETASDDPGPARPTPVADPCEETHLGRLLRQLLDHRAPRTALAPSLLTHEHVRGGTEPHGEGLCLWNAFSSTHRYTVVNVADEV